MKKITFLFILSLFVFSCKETTKKTPVISTQKVAAVYKSVAVDIEGMTCEIACARMIQSKLSKVAGVTYAKVNFEAKKGIFTYDSNQVNEAVIVEKIEKIAGGDLYKVSKTTALEEVVKEVSKE